MDLNSPEKSLFVAAPLADMKTPAGKTCAPAPYADASDPDCAEVLRLLGEASRRSWKKPRRDLRCLVDHDDLRACVSFEGGPDLGLVALRPTDKPQAQGAR